MSAQTPGPTPSSNIPRHPLLLPPPSNNDGSHYAAQNSNLPNEYVQMVLNFRNTALRRMPITSQNELAHIQLSIWATVSKKLIESSMLYDTGTTLNTDYVPYHN